MKVQAMPPLTKTETELVIRVAKEFKVERHYCFVNAQRMTLYSDGRFLYHEGTFGVTCMAHAWNTINGKIIDVSCSLGAVIREDCYSLYKAVGTFTVNDVVANSIKNRLMWNWILEPETLGWLHEEA
jgi:hypothetical protein